MFYRHIILLCCFVTLSLQAPKYAMSMDTALYDGPITISLTQKTSDAPKWRLIYVEGGPYIDYSQIFKATVDAMEELGLIQNAYPYDVVNENDSKKIWEWLTEHAGGDYIEFVKDGFYSSEWDEALQSQNKKDILERIATKKDIDVILTYGTSAGLRFATDEHTIPVLSMSVTDAVQAGIIKSVEDSGLDHVHGQVELGRYVRQLAIFHDIFKFKKLGVPVPTTDEGRASVAYDDIEKTAKALEFEIIPCEMDYYSKETAFFTHLQQCITTLSQEADAIYLTTNSGMQWDKMQALLAPIVKAEIPSFSQSGLMETKLGVLMSIAQSSFASEGLHGATALKKILEGTKPRDIGQTFEGPLGLALNLEMARLIGWNPPFEILVAVDLVYQEIQSVEDGK